MVNPIKLYLGLAAVAVTVTAIVGALSSDEEEVVENTEPTEAEKAKAKAAKKARKKEIKALYGVNVETVTEIDIRSGNSRIDGNVLFYDDITKRPFVTNGTLVIGKPIGPVNKLMRKVGYKQVRLDNFLPDNITLIKGDNSSGFSFKSNVDMPNADQELN